MLESTFFFVFLAWFFVWVILALIEIGLYIDQFEKGGLDPEQGRNFAIDSFIHNALWPIHGVRRAR